MKRLSILFVFLLGYSFSYAQNNCSNPHRIFKVPTGKTPKVVTKLGTNPQFTSLRHLGSADDAYTKMKALGNNAKHRNEINSLFMSLGYTGVNDPAFGREDIKAAEVPFGAMGMLGDGSNAYEYSLIAVTQRPTVKAWYISPKDNGCGLYVMSDCGNAFFHSNAGEVNDRERIVKEYIQPEPGKVKVNVYARYRDAGDCEWCSECDVPGVGKVTEQKVLVAQEDINDIQGGADYTVRNVYIDVDKKTFKRIKYAPEDAKNTGWMPDSYSSK